MNQISIKEWIKGMDESNVLIPHIQRRFVWNKRDIEIFMDSLLNNYPCPPVLSWNITAKEYASKVSGGDISKCDLFKFNRDFIENSPVSKSKPTNLASKDKDQKLDIIFDGQQRLTSIYIAFTGELTKKKLTVKNKNSETSYALYLSLDKRNDKDNIQFHFIDSELDKKQDYFKVSDMQDITAYCESENESLEKINKYILENNIDDEGKERIIKLYDVFTSKNIIHKMNISTDKEFNDVIDIFIRLNNGGTPLDSWELIYSRLIANWEGGKEKIDKLSEDFTREAQTGNKFDRGFIISSCIYLVADDTIIRADKIIESKELTAKIVHRIRNDWKNIVQAFEVAANLLHMFYKHIKIPSFYPLLPIMYYVYKFNKNYYDYFKDIADGREFRDNARDFLFISFVKNAFSNGPYTILAQAKNEIDMWFINKNNDKKFTVEKFYNSDFIKIRGTERFCLTEENINNILDKLSKNNMTLIVLANLKEYQNVVGKETISLHQDHIFAQALFSKWHFEKVYSQGQEVNDREREIITKKQEEWTILKDKLPNLQLLTQNENQSKKDKTIEQWLSESNENKVKYSEVHKVENNERIVDKWEEWNVKNFEDFYNNRRQNIFNELKDRFSFGNYIQNKTNN
ncbi:DUF262 domain-containing protein [Mycoplasma sp. VS276A1]